MSNNDNSYKIAVILAHVLRFRPDNEQFGQRLEKLIGFLVES